MRNLTLCTCLLLVSLTAIAGQPRAPVQRPNCESPSTRSEELVCRKGPLTESELNEIELPGGRRLLTMLEQPYSGQGYEHGYQSHWGPRLQLSRYSRETLEIYEDDASLLYSAYTAKGQWVTKLKGVRVNGLTPEIANMAPNSVANAELATVIHQHAAAFRSAVETLKSVSPMPARTSNVCVSYLSDAKRIGARALYATELDCQTASHPVTHVGPQPHAPVLTKISVSAILSLPHPQHIVVRLFYKPSRSLELINRNKAKVYPIPDAVLAVVAKIELHPNGTYFIRELAVPFITDSPAE